MDVPANAGFLSNKAAMLRYTTERKFWLNDLLHGEYLHRQFAALLAEGVSELKYLKVC